MQHSFDIEIATKFGVEVAIFLNNLSFWIQKNQANEKHLHEGRYWTYNSVKAYSVLFPYWSAKQIRTIVDKCIKHDLIMKSNFNNVQYDRTSWYALTDKCHKLLNIPIFPNGQIDLVKKANQSDQKGEPIPDIKPDLKPDKKIKTFSVQKQNKPVDKNENRFKWDEEKRKKGLFHIKNIIKSLGVHNHESHGSENNRDNIR